MDFSITKRIIVALLLTCIIQVKAQKKVLNPDSGGELPHQTAICVSEELHERMRLESIENMKRLSIFKEDKAERNQLLVTLIWPLQQAAGFNDNGFSVITNYVDEDATTGILDYNCGNRTYNGHKGIDVMLFPFRWNMQAVGQVNVVAGYEGTIIYKIDGFNDMNCSCSSFDWNAVLVQHIDGSIAWYGHLKNGSSTAKSVGQTVSQGEYLGKVGSSGCSTDPHLHFEMYANSSQTNLIDPFAGSCNTFNGSTSWWTSQKPYRTPTLHKLMTHNCAPAQNFGCPANNDVMCAETNLSAGSLIRFSAHYSDQLSGTNTTFRIKRPNGSVWTNWTFSSPGTYNYGSWWNWSYNIPTAEPNGTWTFEATYEGQTVVHNFSISGAGLPVELLNFQGIVEVNHNRLTWQTATETNNDYFQVERSTDGRAFENIGTVKGQGNSYQKNQYSYLDSSPYPTTYYRLASVDFDGKKESSKVIVVNRDQKDNWVKMAFEANENLNVQLIDDKEDAIQVEIFDMTGKLILKINLDTNTMSQNINMSNFSAGMYVVKASAGNRIYAQRIIKS